MKANRLTANPKTLFLLLIFAALAGANVFSQTQVSPAPSPTPSQGSGQSRRPLPPAQYIPAHDYDQRNIKLNLRFDWEKEQAIGTATITLAPVANNFSRVEFDAAYMVIGGVTLASGTPLKFDYDEAKEKLSVSLDRQYQPNEELTVVVSYHTVALPPEKTIGIGGGGLNFIKPRIDDPSRPKQIWTQGESEYNHYWFPSFDHPNDFVSSEIVATVEKPLSVISNGKLAEVKDNPDGTRTFDWKMDQPHATYLVSMVIGEYAAVTSEYARLPVITYVYPSEVEEGKVTAARLAEMVKFFSEKTGVTYPYDKYAQTMARDFPGGMENITATTQTDTMIQDARTQLDSTQDSLQSHELAHQWFGDLLTCRHWSDLWLNESFATYFQAMWDEHSLGHDDFLYLDVRANQEAYYAAWSRGQRHPIVTKNYSNPDAMFDTYAYPRGGAVLHMLRDVLGEENWWRAINHYLTKHRNQPVETEQLRIAIEEATGRPVDWFFDEWLYKMGHPVFRVTQDYDARKKMLSLKVRQEQRVDPESDFPQVTFFQMPVQIEIGTAASTRVERVQLAAKEEQTFTFAVESEPLLVNFDYGGTLIKELNFNKTTGQLLYQLANDRDVLGRIWSLHELATRLGDDKTLKNDRDAIIKAIGDTVVKDGFWGTRLEAATILNGIKEAKDALLTATKDPDARVRARAVYSLASTKDPYFAGTYQQMLNDPSYATIRAAAQALGQTKSPQAYDALIKLIEAPSWRDTIRASGLTGLAALGDKRALALGLKYQGAPNPATVRGAALYLVVATGKDDPRAFAIVSDALQDAYFTRSFALMTSAAEALIALGDERGIGVFQDLRRKSASLPDLVEAFSEYEARLRGKLAVQKPKS
jgi:aminopeptidase N